MTAVTRPLVLMVDDEPLLLDGMRRALRGRYQVETAQTAAHALDLQRRAVDGGTPFDVVVSDMVMPEVDGARFLAEARVVDPDAVRIVLSGQADLPSTIAAVNDAGIFRFLIKPCEASDLSRALDEALELRRLRLAERELLERTLQGATQALADVLRMASPELAGRARRVEHLVLAVADALDLAEDWQLRLAATLSQVGCMAVPPQVLRKLETGTDLSPAEQEMVGAHPGTAADLLTGIPRLDAVADLVRHQATDPDGPPPPGASPTLLALHAATAFHAAFEATGDPRGALDRLAATGHYGDDVLRAVRVASASLHPDGGERRMVSAAELTWGMLVEQDVTTATGSVLVRKGEWISETMAVRIDNFARTVGVVEPIPVLQVRTARRWPPRRSAGAGAAPPQA